MPSGRRPIRVGLVLYPGCTPAGLFAFADLLHSANRLAGQPVFETAFIAAQAGPVECTHGQVLKATHAIPDARVDALLVPGFLAESSTQVREVAKQNQTLIRTLREMPRSVGAWSYCTGVAFVAAARRLNGSSATVTWWLAEAMRRDFADVQWQTERTCVWSRSAATAAGANGYLEIAQHLIEEELSPDAYGNLKKLLVLPRPERSHDVFRVLNLMERSDPLIRSLYATVHALSATELTVARLAEALNTTERTLARKTKALTGVSVASHVRTIKLHQVSERLVHTKAPASSISGELGFSSESAMSRMFKELTGLTPAQYRQTFSKLGAS
ncbi:GlxA family transcriptional regulator [Piscinibacter gummiphilus]|uniref:Helix-turn-helix domain-containing protein n=1 Tax=Piscinibacter gummiphilus TaxID=946333 RepID=A0ABZ0D604_9BURK|nr:helix-turn-helix domain-containing protein [Piscinibacter gummiphilus]WOB10094.1 helix-turn-helix domain-containing protein [Piscinibacter gummiphilus]